ncbi:MAG: hypothetical protein ACR2HX_05590 [Pyrinomonadaceae bacterium]
MPTTIMRRGLLIAALACCASSVAAQDNVQRPSGSAVRSAPPACSAQDKVEVASFTLNPAAPSLGQTVTVRLKIRSKCPPGTADLRVPWEIRKNSTKISSGTETLPPGISKDVTTTWTAVVGTNNFYGSVTMTDGGNNNTSNDVTVNLSPPLVTRVLNHVSAKNAGANFSANIVDSSPCVLYSNAGQAGSNSDDEVVNRINCLPDLLGGRSDVEGYSGFTLKNGWRIKSHEIIRGTGNFAEGPGKGWSWSSAPPTGTGPYFKIRLWADANRGIQIGVKIFIEGPEDTDPYQ